MEKNEVGRSVCVLLFSLFAVLGQVSVWIGSPRANSKAKEFLGMLSFCVSQGLVLELLLHRLGLFQEKGAKAKTRPATPVRVEKGQKDEEPVKAAWDPVRATLAKKMRRLKRDQDLLLEP